MKIYLDDLQPEDEVYVNDQPVDLPEVPEDKAEVTETFEGIFGVSLGTPRDPASGPYFDQIDPAMQGGNSYRMRVSQGGQELSYFIMVENYGGLTYKEKEGHWVLAPLNATGDVIQDPSGVYDIEINTSKWILYFTIEVDGTKPPERWNLTRLASGNRSRFEYAWR